ncbi:MAG TPA: hypothetical protein DCZ12_09795 [Gammaproteobacteria bacterium]|nr:hypothetical protein [Gammaproteobacteria bacterium]
MSRLFTRVRVRECTLIAVVFVLLLFLSPVADFWAGLGAPWYAPYLVWGIAILCAFLLQRYLKKYAF